MSLCDTCKLQRLNLNSCKGHQPNHTCMDYDEEDSQEECIPSKDDPVNAPRHYIGKIECIEYLRDKLTQEEFTGFCIGNVLKYCSRWRKKAGAQDLEKARVYLNWAIDNETSGTESP